MSGHTEELIAQSQAGDMAAKETLIEENSGLIWAIVRRYLGRGTEAEDLYQLGCLGFLKAVDGFDLQYGTQFSTYAVPKISGEIRRFLRDDGAVKVSRSIKERAASIKSARNQLVIDLNREPTIQEISEIIGCDCTYLTKVRLGPDNVETKIVDVRCDSESDNTVNVDSVKGMHAIIVDDIIATGGTIVNAINILKQYGASSVDVCCVHPILTNNGATRIYAAGADKIIGTNSLSSDTSRVSIAKAIADALRE